LTVKLDLEKPDEDDQSDFIITREVFENLNNKKDDIEEKVDDKTTLKDEELKKLKEDLTKLADEYEKTKEEITDLYLLVTTRDNLKQYLKDEKLAASQLSKTNR
jgi:hypothetical protein